VRSGDVAFCLYFHPSKRSTARSINVLPDFIKPGAVEIAGVCVNGRERTNFHPHRFQIQLDPEDLDRDVIVRFRVRKQQASAG
jgi:hypothetical protein